MSVGKELSSYFCSRKDDDEVLGIGKKRKEGKWNVSIEKYIGLEECLHMYGREVDEQRCNSLKSSLKHFIEQPAGRDDYSRNGRWKNW